MMPKNILIFSDGTGQVGGVRPDQRLSNVYKMYRAMRPGPDSRIKPSEQACFYDPGLGAGEVDGLTWKKTRNILSAAIGTGIDENVIDCYEKIISYYEPGDKVLLFGFSRGAYTVRALANVMNLCGIPTEMPDGSPVPKYGKNLRKIASDAVNYVYNHGTGKKRTEQPYFKNREELGRRFRNKYKSFVPDVADEEDVRGNVEPHFIGVFDTVAALGNGIIFSAICAVIILLFIMSVFFWQYQWHWFLSVAPLGAIFSLLVWYVKVLWSQFKYFSPDPDNRLNIYNPRDWPTIWKNGHRAKWDMKNYDQFLSGEVMFARHAIAIDEARAKFPRVKWGQSPTVISKSQQKPAYLKQIWFPGCHSDVGGSYPEDESRLSDIALDWMVEELKDCMPDIQINENMLFRSPDATALQHEERYIFKFWFIKIRWKKKPRMVGEDFPLHPSVIERLKAKHVQQVDELKPYRPKQLRQHLELVEFYKTKLEKKSSD